MEWGCSLWEPADLEGISTKFKVVIECLAPRTCRYQVGLHVRAAEGFEGVSLARDAKVCELDEEIVWTAARGQDVAGLDVSVHDPGVLRV